MGEKDMMLYTGGSLSEPLLQSPMRFRPPKRSWNPFEGFRRTSRNRKIAALGAVVALGFAYNANKETVASTVMECPAGYEWSGPADLKPECKKGLPQPLASEVEWPNRSGDTTSGIAEWQITNLAAVEGGVGVVVEFTPDEEGFAEVFQEGYDINQIKAQDYAANIVAVEGLGPEACAAEMGAIIDWAKAGADGMNIVDENHRTTLETGESLYSIEGHGGTSADTPLPNITVVTQVADGQFEPVSCRS